MPLKPKIYSTRTIKELKKIILSYNPTFVENNSCMTEEIEKHYIEHGYKPEEQGYIALKYVFGKLKVTRRYCLVLMFVKLKNESRTVKIKWEKPWYKGTEYSTHGRR